jgi:MtaA/CmuA family methyltransferase
VTTRNTWAWTAKDLPRAQPSLVAHPAPSKEDFERLRDRYHRQGFDPEAGRLRTIQREIEIFIEHGWKDHHAILTAVGGPITTAQLLTTGSSNFLTYLAEDPAYARELIDLALDDVKNVCRMMHEAGVDACNILEPFLSCDVLPPEVFREFALPALKELFAYLRDDLGAPSAVHICTYTQPIWSDIADSGCLNFNGDLYRHRSRQARHRPAGLAHGLGQSAHHDGGRVGTGCRE